MKDNTPTTNIINKFIEKTFRLVNEQTAAKGPIHWSANGKSFEVDNIPRLEKLMPLYFNSDKYSSFVRQLNIYGFQIIKRNKRTTFRHPFFLQYAPEKLYMIKNKKAFATTKDGFGQVLREIEQYKLSNKLLDDKLADLEGKEDKSNDNLDKKLKEKDESIKALLKVALLLVKLSKDEAAFRDVFEDLKVANPLFKRIDGYVDFNDFITNAEVEKEKVDESVRYLCDYVMENVNVRQEQAKSFNLSFFDLESKLEKNEPKEEQANSGFFGFLKAEEGHEKIPLGLMKTDEKKGISMVEEDMSFKLMEGFGEEVRNVNRVLDFK